METSVEGISPAQSHGWGIFGDAFQRPHTYLLLDLMAGVIRVYSPYRGLGGGVKLNIPAGMKLNISAK